MKTLLLSILSLFVLPLSFGQTVYTFTTATATGANGPTQVQTDAEYATTNLNGMVTVNTQGIQEWVVPASGTYTIETWGAQGGNTGALGAYMSGDFNLTAGETIKIIVGQEGGYMGFGSGGGGGSFVVDNSNSPLIIAGGGGGSGHSGAGTGSPVGGQTTTAGTAGFNTGAGLGGTAGNGGESSSSYGGTYNNSGGGGGLLTDGVGDGTQTNPGLSFLNGGLGGEDTGGFGGGGGGIAHDWNCSNGNGGGSGGGGYSGGGGGGGSCNGGGGGGGSFNGGTNQNNIAATNSGAGSVVITSNCTPASITPDIAMLADESAMCSITATTPTASNNCGTVVNGTPDVTFPLTTVGTTVVTWTYDDGWGNTTTQTQNVIVLGPDVTVTVTGGLISSNELVASYQWLDCDDNFALINGEVNQFYEPAMTGNYAVEVTKGGCTDTSECTLVDLTGIEELSLEGKTLVKIVDFMGRETDFKPNTPLIFIYSDGTRERVMEIEYK